MSYLFLSYLFSTIYFQLSLFDYLFSLSIAKDSIKRPNTQ
ncbi:hypothetical protein HMPREF6123_1243 [Oribacterium sinus F0268]|uniref:Uncharacterized protein n=1 Tax=Oribacterium sinus F0268 TaxID=585501 RepID=C2KXM4_9FIRM|nr:hypothetical protein HMPREF6123_1243 [Oribacterium sinus F0268]